MSRLFRRNVVLIVLSCTAYIPLQAMQFATPLPKNAPEILGQKKVAKNIDFGRHFRDLGVQGAIVIYDPTSDRLLQYNPQRNKTAFLPGSTFKILNTLIALETGVMGDEIEVLTWDGISRKVPAWNRDLNMREAFRLSAIWFYQVIARRIGHEQMQNWVTRARYGNQNIGPQADIDQFWLNGALRITPQQQIQFLQRLYKNDLPFSARSLSLVKDLMVMEQTPDYTIRGKTGWVGFTDNVTPNIGWHVGYLEKGKQVYFFTTNIDIRNSKDSAARTELTRRCLKDLGLL